MLVVISIISLLSSVVLSAVSSARAKAENSASKSIAGEYKNAFDLYYSNFGKYPVPTDIIATGVLVTCLGDYTSDACYDNGTRSESPVLNAAIRPYLPSRQAIKPLPIGSSGIYVNSPMYYCNDATCLYPNMDWYLAGENQSCGFGIPPVGAAANASGYSQTRYLTPTATYCSLNLR